MAEGPVDSNERGNIGRLVLAKYLNAAATTTSTGGPLMADGEQRPSRALRVMRCERRTSQQLGGLVAVVLRADVKREQVTELARRAGHDLRQFLPSSISLSWRSWRCVTCWRDAAVRAAARACSS